MILKILCVNKEGYMYYSVYKFEFTWCLFNSGPMTRFFSTLYPKPIVLSAGTSYTLPVTFRPLEKVIYNDHMEFETKVSIISYGLS